MYTYQAEVVRWVDGDTVILDVDMGFRIKVKSSFRLYGIDTPERGSIGYKLAVETVNTWAPVGSTVTIHTHKDADKYGRWLVEIDSSDTATLNDLLIEAGMAKPYYGGKK